MNKNQTNYKCRYYNFGGDSKKGYSSYPTAYGARCEKYKEFFIMKDNELTPNCYECLNKEKKMEIKKIDEVKVYGINTNVYEYDNVKYVLIREVCDWIGYNAGSSNKLAKRTTPDNLLKKDIYYKGQNRKMWFVNNQGVKDIFMNSNITDIMESPNRPFINFNQHPRDYFYKMKEIIELNEVMHDKLNDFMEMLNS